MASQLIQDQLALEKLQAFLKKNGLPFSDVKLEGSVYLTYLDDQQELIASGGLELYDTHALLRSVAVEQQQRGKKLGHKIIQDLIGQAQSLGIAEVYLLTETAEEFFAQRGFNKVSRDHAPADILSSSEFKTVCPVSAACMVFKFSKE
jgi:N-acetylglutamate synthase-like GNAT family acetyltransferase